MDYNDHVANIEKRIRDNPHGATTMTVIFEIAPPCVPFGSCNYQFANTRFRRWWFLWFGITIIRHMDLHDVLRYVESGATSWRTP